MLKVTLYSIAIAALLTGGSTFGQEQTKSVPSDDKQKIVEQLQGKWIVVEVRSCDKGATAFVEEFDFGRKVIFNFKDTTYTVTQDDGKGEILTDPDELQEFSIDASKSPIWIEYEGSKGILRLEDDTLTICFGAGKERPTRFDLVEGDKAEQYMERIVLNRFKPKGGKQNNDTTPPVALPKGLEQLQGTWTCVGILGGQSFLEEFTGEIPDIKIKGDTAIALRKSGEKRTKCKISIDDTKQPMRIDIGSQQLFSKTAGPEFSPTPLKGVFRIEGDKLTICIRHREYPADFDLTPIQVPFIFKKQQ